MGSKLGGSDEEAIVDINITPFVDIILVVLIIFMVTTTYIVRQSINVNLPDAATGEATKSTSLGITIDQEGQLFLDGEPLSEGELRRHVRAAKKAADTNQGEDVVVLVSADHAISHGQVVGVIDLVRQEGVSKFAIDINPVSAPASPEADGTPENAPEQAPQ